MLHLAVSTISACNYLIKTVAPGGCSCTAPFDFRTSGLLQSVLYPPRSHPKKTLRKIAFRMTVMAVIESILVTTNNCDDRSIWSTRTGPGTSYTWD